MWNRRLLRRYHVNVWMPSNIHDMVENFRTSIPDVIGITNHAARELMNDTAPTPTKDNIFGNDSQIIEAYEILNGIATRKPTGKIQKLVMRVQNLSPDRDFTYVISNDGWVVSGWANDKNDLHRLTGNGRYYAPKKIYVKETT